MKQIYKQLGKVRPTVEGDWSIDKNYTLLSIVYDEIGNASYISRKDVPAGIQITNKEYWTRFSNTRVNSDSIVLLSKIQDDGLINSYDLQEAIDSFKIEDRRLGTFISFYEKPIGESTDYRWNLYQFNSNNIDDWDNTKYWQSIYYIQNKFLGLFSSEESLKRTRPFPIIGDYAFVGATLKEAIVYRCNNIGVWTRTNEKAKDYLSINLKGDITISEEGNWIIDGVDTGISSKGEDGKTPLLRIKDYKWQVSYDGGIIYKDIPNSPIFVKEDDEDIAGDLQTDGVKLLKFADKEYNVSKFSGLGRVYLRKNIVNGKNVLTQEMINKPNTIYIIQYDYDLDNEEINIPENCTLQFDGGSFKNGILNGKLNTNIISKNKCFDNIEFNNFNIVFEADWFINILTNTIYNKGNDCLNQMQYMFNSGILKIHFNNGRIYYVSDTIIITKKVEIIGDTYMNTPDTLKTTIMSDISKPIIKYIRNTDVAFSDKISLKGIKILSKDKTNNLDTSIVQLLINKDCWYIYIDLIIDSTFILKDDELNFKNRTGLEIKANETSYMSMIRLNGYISSFNGIKIIKGTWATDCIINCETSCVCGGNFEISPVIIKNSHQPNAYYRTNENNNVPYFKIIGTSYIEGIIWDLNVGNKYKTCAIDVDANYINCKNSQDVYTNKVPNSDRYNLLYFTNAIINPNEVNLNVKVGNNKNFDDIVYTKNEIFNYNSIINLNISGFQNYRYNHKDYEFNRPPHFKPTLTDIIKSWDALYIEYKFELYSLYNRIIKLGCCNDTTIKCIFDYYSYNKNKLYTNTTIIKIDGTNLSDYIYIPYINDSYKVNITLLYEIKKDNMWFFNYNVIPLPTFNVSGMIENQNSMMGLKTELPIVCKDIMYKTKTEDTDIYNYRTYPIIMGEFSFLLTNTFYMIYNNSSECLCFDCFYGSSNKNYNNLVRVEITGKSIVISGGDDLINVNHFGFKEINAYSCLKIIFPKANIINIYKVQGRDVRCRRKLDESILVEDSFTSIIKYPNIVFGDILPKSKLDIGYQISLPNKGKTIFWNGSYWVDSINNRYDALKKGTTVQRPTGVQIGFTYKDTDLNKWIIWNGEAWENIDGTALD